jgi:hypothetical protein
MAIGKTEKVMRARTIGNLATKTAAIGRMATMRKGSIGRTIKNKFDPADKQAGSFCIFETKGGVGVAYKDLKAPAKRPKRATTAKKKVVKSAKPVEIEPIVESDDVYRCTCCGHKYKKQETNFSASKSPIYKGNNGYLSICRNCIAELYEQYVKFYDGDEDAAAERICQITDMYFDKDIWAMSRKISNRSEGKPRNRVSVYVSRLNLRAASGATTYSDTLVRQWEADVENAETVEEVEQNEDIEVPVETVKRFGTGFKEGEYQALQDEYDSWVTKYGEPEDKRQEELYVTICYMKLNLQKATRSDAGGVGALANSYKQLIEAATTEIEDRKRKVEAEMELKPLGVLYRDIEQFTPAEFYKDKKLYKDFDYLKEYIERFMKRPLKNLLTGSKELDKEFNLSETEG